MLLLLLLASSPAAGRSAIYTVRAGDNLSVIARRFGTTVDDLRRDNALTTDLLAIGQRVAIVEPFAGGENHEPRWERPARRLGAVLRPFGPYKKGRVLMPRTGTDVACGVGEVLTAPAVGVVRFLGPMDGYGHLVILDHGGGWATVLGPLDPTALAVDEGTAVLAGDRLGRVGEPVEEGPPYLHVELRRNEKAVAPDRLHK